MLCILSIDDNPDDRLLAIRELRRGFADLMVEEVGDARGFEQALLKGGFDLVVTDYRLRWSDGLTVLRTIKAQYPDIPVVMFTNSGNEEVAVEGMKAGLDDYVIKSPKHAFRLSVAVKLALEQFQQRQALKEAETRYSSLFDRVPVGLYRITSEGQIKAANPALVQLLGYPERQALLAISKIDIHIDAQARQQWQEGMERDGVVRNLETPLRTLEGKIIWVRHNATSVKDSKGKVLYYEGAIEDITERKQVEEERQALLVREQAARAEAETASRMKDEFLATLSHELRTPLNAMLGWASLLRTRKFDEAITARALETIERNAKAQTQMIEDLLDISRIIRGNLRLTLYPVALIKVIEAAIDALHLAATAKVIQLETVYESLEVGVQEQGVLVMGDSSRLQQIVWNLLSNAIKFTPSGGRVEVRLSVEMGNANEKLPISSYAQIQVKDTGQGISTDFLPYVFDYFRQADSTSTRSHGGLGLGLAIVRQLVELHSGTVEASSPGVGQGATFTVKLPLLKHPSEQVTRDKSQAYLSPLVSQSLPLAVLQVLLVEDEVDTREMLSLALEEYGAKVIAVASAAEAKSVIAKFQPDVIISDIAMPQEDGYSLIRQLREQGKQIPAIALTAYARESDRDGAKAAGFQRYLSKPVEPEELVAVITDLVGKQV